MKKILTLAVLVIFMACAKAEKTHTETAQIVVESFYEKDLSTLKKYTSEQSFQAFLSIQEKFTATETETSNFKVVEETKEGDNAWVKFTTAYEENPETFKLIKENSSWKVTERGLGEKAPYIFKNLIINSKFKFLSSTAGRPRNFRCKIVTRFLLIFLV